MTGSHSTQAKRSFSWHHWTWTLQHTAHWHGYSNGRRRDWSKLLQMDGGAELDWSVHLHTVAWWTQKVTFWSRCRPQMLSRRRRFCSISVFSREPLQVNTNNFLVIADWQSNMIDEHVYVLYGDRVGWIYLSNTYKEWASELFYLCKKLSFRQLANYSQT